MPISSVLVFFQIGDHEVECQPHFRMYLHTTVMPHQVPPELMAHVAVIRFCQTLPDIEDELLNRFMAHEKSRMEEEKTTLLEVRVELN